MDDMHLIEQTHGATANPLNAETPAQEPTPNDGGSPGSPILQGLGIGDDPMWVFIGMTGDGRYALVRKDDFDCVRPPRAKMLKLSEFGMRMALVEPVPVPRRSGDRRGGWARPPCS